MAYGIVGIDLTIWRPYPESTTFSMSRQDLPKAVGIDTYGGMPSLTLRYQSTAQGPNKLKSLLAEIEADHVDDISPSSHPGARVIRNLVKIRSPTQTAAKTRDVRAALVAW
jgi:hypothetical protein